VDFRPLPGIITFNEESIAGISFIRRRPRFPGRILVACDATRWRPTLPALERVHGVFLPRWSASSHRTPDAVVSPADGRVMIAGPSDRPLTHRRLEHVTIFLSPLGRAHSIVHRSPAGFTRGRLPPGQILPAYRPTINDKQLNEVWVRLSRPDALSSSGGWDFARRSRSAAFMKADP
jgi:hypothetical protein